MSILDGLLAGIVAEPLEETRWLVLADWLEEFDDPRRAELLRLHRKLVATCCEPELYPDRKQWQAQIVELLLASVQPCVPQTTLSLPGGMEMTFSFIPPGVFRMGSKQRNALPSEKPAHRVRLTKGFYLGVYPVTQARWAAVMGTNPSHFKGPNRPVDTVSRDDCQAFCEKLTMHLGGHGKVRLPSEAEWEYACRAGTTTEYHTGNGWATFKKTGWLQPAETRPVGKLMGNAWGLHDFYGNVWEWCQDSYAPYPRGEVTDYVKIDKQSNHYVLRGGSVRYGFYDCRVTGRLQWSNGARDDAGCRVVFNPDEL